MFALITFGGLAFWLFIAAFVILEGALLYHDKNGLSLFSFNQHND